MRQSVENEKTEAQLHIRLYPEDVELIEKLKRSTKKSADRKISKLVRDALEALAEKRGIAIESGS
jgi:flagellar biosynthesis/type III secretory pathway protein FliH